MSNFSTDLLKIQNSLEEQNTWYRAPKVSPSIQKVSSDCLMVKTINDEAPIYRFEEVILSILASFKFIPYWLVQNWYEVKNERSIANSVVASWINVGLVWIETSPTGVYLRPTRFLLNMFGDTSTDFVNIPYSTLAHTLSEEQLCFDIQIGNPKSELWHIIKKENTLPCYHPLLTDLDENPPLNEEGTVIIREADFRKGNQFKSEDELLEKDTLIKVQIELLKDKPVGFTEEFRDFSLFPLVTINENNLGDKNRVYTQNPDCIIPIPRVNGKPMSYAIEIELTQKPAGKYDAIMQSYKDNIKYGKVFYLCGNQKIAKLVKEAFQRAKGLGSCELYILGFTPPSMNIGNFNYEDEKEQSKLLKTSTEVNK